MKTVRSRFGFITLIIMLISCDGQNGQPVAPIELESMDLVFAGVDPYAMPWQSTIYNLDFETQEITKMLDGESSDPAFFQIGDSIMFFNRSSDSRNFRFLDADDSGFQLTSQINFANGEVGDPHDALEIDDKRVLLAHYTQGALTVIDRFNGEFLTDLSFDWDLPDSLKPEGLVKFEVNGETIIYVIHQGLSFEGSAVVPNGNQKVFVIKFADGKFTPVDLDERKGRIQGIDVQGSFPVPVKMPNQQSLILVSMCSRFVSEIRKECISAIEEINPQSNEIRLVWDLEDLPLYMNGTVVAGSGENQIFVGVDESTRSGSSKKQVIKMNLLDHTYESVYDYPAESAGFWGLFYDSTREILYVGDIGDELSGKFVVIDRESRRQNIDIGRVPYSGTVFRK